MTVSFGIHMGPSFIIILPMTSSINGFHNITIKVTSNGKASDLYSKRAWFQSAQDVPPVVIFVSISSETCRQQVYFSPASSYFLSNPLPSHYPAYRQHDPTNTANVIK
jgi:hypothetical protein